MSNTNNDSDERKTGHTKSVNFKLNNDLDINPISKDDAIDNVDGDDDVDDDQSSYSWGKLYENNCDEAEECSKWEYMPYPYSDKKCEWHLMGGKIIESANDFENYPYEEIDVNSITNVDRFQSNKKYKMHDAPYSVINTTADDSKVLKKGTVVLLITLITSKLDSISNAILTNDKDGDALIMLENETSMFDDYSKEPWFYPVAITPYQATLFLKDVDYKGCFLVYKPETDVVDSKGCKVVCYLSVVLSKGNVFHYEVRELPTGCYVIEDEGKTFLAIKQMIDYYQSDKRNLITRLRRPLKSNTNILRNFNPKDEINRKFIILADKLKNNSTIYDKYYGVVENESNQITKAEIKILMAKHTLPVIENFAYEVNILKSIKHENITTFIGISFSQKPYYILTEYTHYGKLRTCLLNKTLPNPQIISLKMICVQIIYAAIYLEHRKYIIHRNISTSSLYVTDNFVIKLGDFDKARMTTSDTFTAEEDEQIDVTYASPEVLEKLMYSTKSDIWAIGITIWEVFSSGALPQQEKCNQEIISFIMSGFKLERPSICDELSYEIINKCWEFEMDKRTTLGVLLRYFNNYYGTTCTNPSKRERSYSGQNYGKLKNDIHSSKYSMSGNYNPWNTIKQNVQTTLRNTLDRRFTIGSMPNFLTPSSIRRSIRSSTVVENKKFRQVTGQSRDSLMRGCHMKEQSVSAQDIHFDNINRQHILEYFAIDS